MPSAWPKTVCASSLAARGPRPVWPSPEDPPGYRLWGGDPMPSAYTKRISASVLAAPRPRPVNPHAVGSMTAHPRLQKDLPLVYWREWTVCAALTG